MSIAPLTSGQAIVKETKHSIILFRLLFSSLKKIREEDEIII